MGPPKRDLMLEHKIAKWILSLEGDKGSQPGDFGGWLADGSVLAGYNVPQSSVKFMMSQSIVKFMTSQQSAKYHISWGLTVQTETIQTVY